MRVDRRWVLIGLGAAVLAAAIALALVAAGDNGDDVASVAGDTTTSLSAAGDPATSSTTITGAATTPTTTAATAAPSRVTTGLTTAPTKAPARCSPPAPGSDFDGFGATEIVIGNAEGSHRSCVLTADTRDQQQRGLMYQDDIDGYDGMIFRFPTAEERAFWMRNTRIPLSIAFFDAGGAFVSASDMEPCGDSPQCPKYPSHGPAKFALEVLKGRLPAVGATSGSRLAA